MSYQYAGQYGAAQVINSSGAPIPNVAVTVYDHGTTTLAILYTDRTKATAGANPVNTDSVGNLTFYADPGAYDIKVAGQTTTATVISALDPGDATASSPGVPVALPGATNPTRYAGGTTSGAPTIGTFAVGDFVVDATGKTWVCTVAGTPGTWQGPGQPANLPGATNPTRYVGGTASGAPTTGTFAVGDFVVDATGLVWVCTAAGTPGTWRQPAIQGSPANLPGATNPTRYVGGTTSGAPTTGTFDVGDYVVDQAGNFIACTTAGTPGSWVFNAGVKGAPLGLAGAVAATRYVGGTSGGAPTTGTFAIGDFVIDETGKVWVCTSAGTPGSWRLITSTYYQTAYFSASGTWVAPANVSVVYAICVGGGGGGGSGYNANSTVSLGGCGGGAGQLSTSILSVSPGTSYTITVAGGGGGGAANYNNTVGNTGAQGGTSTFDSLMHAVGGYGGFGGNSGTAYIGGAPGGTGIAQLGYYQVTGPATAGFGGGQTSTNVNPSLGGGAPIQSGLVGGGGGCGGWSNSANTAGQAGTGGTLFSGGQGGTADYIGIPQSTAAGGSGANNSGGGGGGAGGFYNNGGYAAPYTSGPGGSGGSGYVQILWVA